MVAPLGPARTSQAIEHDSCTAVPAAACAVVPTGTGLRTRYVLERDYNVMYSVSRRVNDTFLTVSPKILLLNYKC